MITTPPNQILDEVIGSVISLLAEGGYRKTARNFVALADGVARVVQFQTSQLKKPDQASFTLAVVITSEAFHEAYTGTPFPKNAGSAETVIQAGLGRLLPDGEPIWWSLKPGVSSSLIAKEVEALLRDPVLPFLSRFRTQAELLNELTDGERLPGFSAMRERCRAVLLVKAGRKVEAAQVLARLIESNSTDGLDGFRESVNKLAKHLGLQA